MLLQPHVLDFWQVLRVPHNLRTRTSNIDAPHRLPANGAAVEARSECLWSRPAVLGFDRVLTFLSVMTVGESSWGSRVRTVDPSTDVSISQDLLTCLRQARLRRGELLRVHAAYADHPSGVQPAAGV
eukprot:1181657-Prorocentrum_minimum.AAC.5